MLRRNNNEKTYATFNIEFWSAFYNILVMKNSFLLLALAWICLFFSCSRNVTVPFENPTLVGKWVLTKSCLCNRCTDSISFFNSQTLIFSSTGQADVFTSVGNSVQHYFGTYSVAQTSGGKILNMKVDSPSPSIFYSIPGSVIISETGTTLVLNVIALNMTQCATINTYTASPN